MQMSMYCELGGRPELVAYQMEVPPIYCVTDDEGCEGSQAGVGMPGVGL